MDIPPFQYSFIGTNAWFCDRTTFQWIFWGYSLAYSRDAGPFIGTLTNFGLKGVMAAPSPGSAVLPEIVFVLYQLLFCACTVSWIVGRVAIYADVHR